MMALLPRDMFAVAIFASKASVCAAISRIPSSLQSPSVCLSRAGSGGGDLQLEHWLTRKTGRKTCVSRLSPWQPK